jgi:signal peptide peptidase SppA
MSLAELQGRTWALKPEVLFGLLRARDRAFAYEASDFALDTESVESRRNAAPRRSGATAILPLKGVLRPQPSLFEMLFGMSSGGGLLGFRSSLATVMADPEVSSIVLDIDSPGGLVDLIPETAAMVREARKTKNVVAVANTLAASAAYWIASQANEVVVTPSGEVGSIGVFVEHTDISKGLEQQGVKPTLVSAGKYKVEGNPYEPLDEEARAALQQDVNDYYNLFTKDVAKGRGVNVSDVKSGFGEGRSLPALRAEKEGLVDRVDTLEATVARVTRGSGASRQPAEQQQGALGVEDDVLELSAEEKERLKSLHYSLIGNETVATVERKE